MQIVGLIFFLAFAPGIFWLWYVYGKDRYAPEPLHLIFKVFSLGALSLFLAIFLEKFIPVLFPAVQSWETSGSHIERTLYYILVIGAVEEFCKLLPVWLFVYKKSEFNEVIDGVVYASASALGFASLENLFYIFGFGPHVMVGRAILSTFGHLLFSIFWGLGLGLAKFNPKHSKYIVVVGLIIASIFHGLYNIFAYASETLILLILIFIIWKLFLVIVEKSRFLSPFKHNWARKMKLCPHCRRLTRQSGKYCGRCGKDIGEIEVLVFSCANCQAEVDKKLTYCPQCGFFLVKET